MDASYQVSVHLANQKQELPVAAMFVNGSGQNQQSSYQVSVHWPSGFRGGELKKMTNQKKELPVAAMFVNGSGWNVQSL